MKQRRAAYKIKLIEMIYEINRTNYFPNQSQIDEVEALIKYEHLFKDEVKSYLSARWN